MKRMVGSAVVVSLTACCLLLTSWVVPSLAAESPAALPSAEPDDQLDVEEAREVLAEPEETPRPSPPQVERGGLLLRGGEQEMEYRLAYAHFSSNTIFIDGIAILPVLVIGEIALERIQRDILIGSWTWRLGAASDTQVELRVPYRYQHGRMSVPEATPPIEQTENDQGMGDISVAVYHQLGKRHFGQSLIVGLEAKSRTGRDIFETTRLQTVSMGMYDDTSSSIVRDGLPMGTGFWGLKGVVTGLRLSDPAALFWNLGYTYTLPRDDITVYGTDPDTMDIAPRVVKVRPGDTLEYGIGLAYALNPELSMNLQFQQAFTQSTSITDPTEGTAQVAGSNLNVASIRLGASWLNGKSTTTDVSVSFGLTKDSPDVVVEVRKVFGG